MLVFANYLTPHCGFFLRTPRRVLIIPSGLENLLPRSFVGSVVEALLAFSSPSMTDVCVLQQPGLVVAFLRPVSADVR